jgi:quercetin dioxygenase-like cupin family protein
MDEKFNESTKNRPEGDRPVDSPVVLIDIPSFIKQIKNEKAWDKNDRNSVTVFKTDKMRVVLVGLHKGAEMTTDHPDNVISIQVISGKIELHANNDSMNIRKKQAVALHEQVPYRVVAVKKSIFLLTVTA